MPRKKTTRSAETAWPGAQAARTPWPLEVRLRIARAVVDEGLALTPVARACGVSATQRSCGCAGIGRGAWPGCCRW
jgi:transposase-like protein